MPQKRIEIPAVGIWPILAAEVLAVALAKEHCGDVRRVLAATPLERVTHRGGKRVTLRACTPEETLEAILQTLAFIAVAPAAPIAETTQIVQEDFLFRCYHNAPDLTLAVLAAARKFWFKQSKARQLEILMARGNPIKYRAAKKPLCVWDCQDGEIAAAFDLATKGKNSASSGDVTKARKSAAATIKRGERKWRIK